MYKYILFDLDGTLTDPGLGITNSVMHALRRWGREVPDRSELYKFIGPPLHESFRKYFGFSEEDSVKSVEYYREHFATKGLYENEVYNGVRELLKALKNSKKTIILATSKPEKFALEILRHFELLEYFDFVAGATMDSSRVDKSDVIKYALESAEISDFSECVMIGDREHDINGAKQFSIDGIGVLYGYGSEEELKAAGAKFIAKDVLDIADILEVDLCL